MYILQYVCFINDIVKAWAEAKYMCSGNLNQTLNTWESTVVLCKQIKAFSEWNSSPSLAKIFWKSFYKESF